MLAGELVTVPLPVPACATVSAKLCGVNVAVTVVAAVMVTVHGPVPVQPPPLQPVNVEPVAGVAVRGTPGVWSYRARDVGAPGVTAGEHVAGPRAAAARVSLV